METIQVSLSQLRINTSNPRIITEVKFESLIDSILAFPKMLELRPIVVDKSLTVLGGNMRCRALQAISQLDESRLMSRLSANKDYLRGAQGAQDETVEFWKNWLNENKVVIVDASNLTDYEIQEFIIKDNVSFGEWDYDDLRANWASEDLSRWGVDVWDADAQPQTGDTKSTEEGQKNTDTIVFKFTIEEWRDVNAYLLKIANTKEEALNVLMQGGYGIEESEAYE